MQRRHLAHRHLSVLIFQSLILALKLATAVSAAAAVYPDPVPEAWKQTWRIFDVDPAVAESVVWPEMQLHKYWRDTIESTADAITYSAGGGGINFSIGIFQMKPTFVEKLEKAWHSSGFANFYKLPFDTSDSAAARRSRISRMTTNEWQVIYLGMFIRLLYHSYCLEGLPMEDQVRLAANAYNRGCEWTQEGCGDIESLRVNMDARTFPRAIFLPDAARRQSYSVLAWEHYQTITK